MEMFPTSTPVQVENSPITTDVLERWRSYLNAFPLPPHLTPTGGCPLADVDDDALLYCPPQLIAHVQRTSSQGGYQVISPRQAPFSTMMVRRKGDEVQLGDHEVGSTANPEDKWPTLFDDDLSMLLPDEPMATPTEEVTLRPKTKTVAVAKGHEAMSDPVLACLIKGRAVVDILRRDDVSGGAEDMAELLASAWGIETSELMELEAYSLGIEGDLHRHAIRSDEVYPTLYAPVHIRGVITAGVSDMDKSLLPPFVAMDWRRMRVYCECVYYNSCTTEAVPIKYMRTGTTPGMRGTARSRRNMLIFGPAPATAWTYAPETFCLVPTKTVEATRKPGIPEDVRVALQHYVSTVRPVSHLLAKGKRVDTWRSAATAIATLSGETLSENYSRVTRTMATGPVRGRTAAAAVRNAIYEQLQSARFNVRTRLVRYLEIASKECVEHLGVAVVPDIVVYELASRFSSLGVFMREKLQREAEMRGASIEEWWEDILSQAPQEYHELSEGTLGWTIVAMWLMFREPTDRWAKLKYAAKMRALSEAAANSVGSIALPAEKGSVDRLVVACRHAVREIATAFTGYYQGVADVGFAISKAATIAGRHTTAEVLKEGAYMWSMRARSLSAINVSAIAHDEPLKSINHTRVPAEPVDIAMKPAPYMAYKAWKKHVAASTAISAAAKKMISEAEKPPKTEYAETRRSGVFQNMRRPIIPCRETIITRYLTKPSKLGDDLEKGWGMLIGDVKKVIKKYATEASEAHVHVEKLAVDLPGENLLAGEYEPEAKRLKIDVCGPRGGPLRNFWEVFAEADQDVSEGILDSVDRLPKQVGEMFCEGLYEDMTHLIDCLEGLENQIATTSKVVTDTVR